MNDLEKLFDLRRKFKSLYERHVGNPELEDELKRLVHEIEELQKKIDVESGFANAQMKTHDFYVRIPSGADSLSKIEGDFAGEILKSVNGIIDTAQPNYSSTVAVNVVGMIPSSTVLLYDIVDKETRVPHRQYSADSTREKVKKIVKSSAKFMEKGFSSEKLREFREETGLSNEQAYEITRSLLRITPTSSDEINKVEIGMIEHDEEFKLTTSNDTVLELNKSKSNIYQIIKPEEKTELIGTLGIMEEWEENHKISILDADGKKHTINYTPTEENIRKIKDMISKQVHIKRMKDSDDRRRWILVEWIG